jgi:hypothetical protein
MALRRIAILVGLFGGAWFLASSLWAADPPVMIQPLPSLPPLPAPPAFQPARPCLIATTSCLELSPTPFAPCLIAMTRCSQEWTVVPLKAFKADNLRHPFRPAVPPAETPNAR